MEETTDTLRMSHVPNGLTPVGYVPYGKNLYDADGKIIQENILKDKPTDGTPYATYYGNHFLTFEHYYQQEALLSPGLVKQLVESLQKIRYLGPSLGVLLDVTQAIGEGYIYGLQLINKGRYYLLNYSLDTEMNIPYKIQRETLWLHVISQKFKQYMPLKLEDSDRRPLQTTVNTDGDLIVVYDDTKITLDMEINAQGELIITYDNTQLDNFTIANGDLYYDYLGVL
jgi:hypothetical protein